MNMKIKSALLVGATGLVGNEVLDFLLNQPGYDKVKVFTRRSLGRNHAKLEEIIVDFDELHQYKEHFKVDSLFCCLGTTIRKAGSQNAFRKVDYHYPLEIAKLAKEGGVQNVLIITAMGADPNSKIFYNRVKGELEKQLKKLNLPSLQLFRPSLLLGDREEFRFGEKIGILLSPLFSLFLVGPLQKYKPIHARVVAKAMFISSLKQSHGNQVYSSDQIYKVGEK
jgi:uncharacterized protein YbjT (DUF2867 family)